MDPREQSEGVVMKTNTTNASAKEAYGAARVRAHSQIIQLQPAQRAWQEPEAAPRVGYAGDINHVADILSHAIEFLGVRRGDDDVIHLPVKPEEVAVLRFALDHALSSTSEAHAEGSRAAPSADRASEAAEKKVRR